MLSDLLNLSGVQIVRVSTTDDGMGGVATTTSTVTTINKCAIFQNNSGKSFLSDRVSAKSSDVLILLPSIYSWSKDDQQIVNGSKIYNIVGIPDDVMGKGEIEVVGLERVI
jgi:hypothetical protein